MLNVIIYYDGDCMSRTDWIYLSVVLFGFMLFLYGANFFNTIVGWIGVYVLMGGIIAFLAIYIYKELTKKEVN